MSRLLAQRASIPPEDRCERCDGVGAHPGFVTGEPVGCRLCGGDGRRHPACETCAGRGYVARERRPGILWAIAEMVVHVQTTQACPTCRGEPLPAWPRK